MGVKWKNKCFLSEIRIHSAEVSKFAIISLPPGEDLPVHGQSHGMASPRMHGDLLHNIVAKCRYLAGDWNGPAGQTQAQPPISSLSTCIDLPLDCHCKNDKSRYLLLWLFLHFSIQLWNQKKNLLSSPTCKKAFGTTSHLHNIECRQRFGERRHLDLWSN